MDISPSIYYEEAIEQLDLVRSKLDKIDYNDYTYDINEIFRAFHTLKGGAGMFGFQNIVNLTHLAEDLLDQIRNNKIRFDNDLKELLLTLSDLLETLSEKMVNKATIDNYTLTQIEDLEIDLKQELSADSPKRIIEQIVPKISQKNEPIAIIPTAPTKKTILIVDDSSMIRSVAGRAAELLGFDVVTATDGREGIEKTKLYNFDLIFSDVNMPQMDGLEMVAQIKKIDAYKFVPIVMLTTEAGEDLKSKGKALGVKAWMVKPFNKDKFSLVLEKLLA